jgi:hypothetical protein
MIVVHLPTLSPGAGTITYASPDALTVLNSEPSCAESGYTTAETANSFYGELSASPSTMFVQSFNVSATKPIIHKEGKPRPGLVIPSVTKF